MSKKLFWLCFALLVLYTASTLLFSAWNEGYVHDEPMYLEIGQWMNKGQHPEPWWGHPPLSIWTGAWLPTYLGFTNYRDPLPLFYSRLSHILIVLASGITIAVLIMRRWGELSSIFFLLLFSTFGLLKFVTSHHLTDADSSVLAALSLVWVWAKPPKNYKQSFIPLCLIVLAILCKVSMVLVSPFVLWGVLNGNIKHLNLKKLILSAVGALFIGLCICYRFRFGDFWQFFHILKLQLGRSGGGSPNSLLGMRVDSGVWYYYIVVAFFKTPLIVAGLFVWSIVLQLRKISDKEGILYILIPALIVFTVFSISSLQLGFRYITLSMLLFYIFIAVQLSKEGRVTSWVLGITSFVLLSTDFYTLMTGSYQTYFNFLSPRNATNFSESNIDWHQRIPAHLLPKAPKSVEVKQSLGFLLDKNKDEEVFQTTSMELNGIWHHPMGVLFRGLVPFQVIAGHEFHSVSKEALYQLLQNREPFHLSKTKNFSQWDKPFVKTGLCKQSEKLVIEGEVLFDLEKILKTIPEKEEHWKGSESVPFKKPGKYLIIIESNAPADLTINGVKGEYPRGSMEEYRNFSYWMGVELDKSNRVEIEYTKRNKDPKSVIKSRVIAFRHTCASPNTYP